MHFRQRERKNCGLFRKLSLHSWDCVFRYIRNQELCSQAASLQVPPLKVEALLPLVRSTWQEPQRGGIPLACTHSGPYKRQAAAECVYQVSVT